MNGSKGRMQRRTIAWSIGVLAMLLMLSPTSARATYPGTNGRIAFAMDLGQGLEVFTMAEDGTDIVQLTHTKGNALNPDWSPDGSKIVFQVDTHGGTEGCKLKLINADGTGLTSLTPRGTCDSDAQFMPSGRRILFMGEDGGAIETMNLVGTHRRVIFSPGNLFMHSPSISPDGQQIVVLVEKEIPGGNRKAVFRVNFDGTDLEKVVPFSQDVSTRGADWAPDSGRLAYSNNAGPTPASNDPANVFTVLPDGSGVQQVTFFARRSVPAYMGSYSPDGQWIIFKRVNFNKNRYVIFKVRPDGTSLTRVIVLHTLPTRAIDWGPA